MYVHIISICLGPESDPLSSKAVSLQNICSPIRRYPPHMVSVAPESSPELAYKFWDYTTEIFEKNSNPQEHGFESVKIQPCMNVVSYVRETRPIQIAGLFCYQARAFLIRAI